MSLKQCEQHRLSRRSEYCSSENQSLGSLRNATIGANVAKWRSVRSADLDARCREWLKRAQNGLGMHVEGASVVSPFHMSRSQTNLRFPHCRSIVRVAKR